jgi:hypothetical protein
MSQLPGSAGAKIGDDKITRYLLDPTHSAEAAAKDRFFVAHGFSRSDWPELRKALFDHAQANPVTRSQTTPYSEKYEVSCSLVTPDGRNPCIASVWIIEPPDLNPRLVTAYPNPP